MASSRNVLIAGAGIGGLSAALMLAQSGFRVTLLEQAERLEETGAGIQLSPNATRILIALGLGPRLRSDVFVPDSVAIKTATGSTLARIPLGGDAERRYGAPYWSIHRADLQAALLEAVRRQSRHFASSRHQGGRLRRAFATASAPPAAAAPAPPTSTASR